MKDLRFICVQPDDTYFTWQVHLWLESLKEIGHSDKAIVLLYIPTGRAKNTKWEQVIALYPEAKAKEYERKPEKIANLVYGSRMGNGDEASGEGFRFRGRGYIQLTGKSNYKAFDAVVEEDIVANPDLVATKYPLLSAAWFFHKNCLGKCVDATDATVTSVTKCVNGGTIGLADRLKHFKQYHSLLV